MSMILTVLLNLAAIVPFVLLCLLVKRADLKKPYRGGQFLMPVIAALYCILAAALF